MIKWETRRCEPAEAFETLRALKHEGYNMLVDLAGLDWLHLGRREKIASADGEEYGTPKPRVERTPEEQAFFAPRPARFEVVYRLMKLDAETGEDKGRVEVRCFVPDGPPVLHSAAVLWPIADWLERELWDMFGVGFVDRPDIKRLYLYESFKGHPLRKDYPIAKRQPQIGPPSGAAPGNPSFNALKPWLRYD